MASPGSMLRIGREINASALIDRVIRRNALVHGGERDRSPPAFLPFQAARTESGRPRPTMRLSALTAIWVSASWAGPAWERRVSPITRLYRLIAASALALWL